MRQIYTTRRYLKGTVNLLANFSASEYNLSRHEDQKDDLRCYHPVDQTRKQFWFILLLVRLDTEMYRREHAVAISEAFQTNWEFNVTASNDILDFEVHEFRIEAEFLDNTRIFTRCETRIIF